jgi:hypothetical protein
MGSRQVTELGALLPAHLISDHPSAEDRAPLSPAEHPGALEVGQQPPNLLWGGADHTSQSVGLEVLTIQAKVAVRVPFVHERQHVDPESSGSEGTHAEPRISQPVRWVKLK